MLEEAGGNPEPATFLETICIVLVRSSIGTRLSPGSATFGFLRTEKGWRPTVPFPRSFRALSAWYLFGVRMCLSLPTLCVGTPFHRGGCGLRSPGPKPLGCNDIDEHPRSLASD
jgi:hypothetical protein